MATLYHDKYGPVVQFIGPDKKRRKLRLSELVRRSDGTLKDGERARRDLDTFVAKLEQVVKAAKYAQPLDDEHTAFVARLGADIRGKLEAYGVLRQAPARSAEMMALGAYLEHYVKLRSDVKTATATFYSHTKRNLIDYFGKQRDIATITPGDADEFRLWLTAPKPTTKNGQGGEGLATNTVRRRCAMAGQFFRQAIRKGMLTANPFHGIGGVVKANKARSYFLSREDAAKVLDACPDAQWRLLFALSRFGGLRTPSEHYGLRWNDIDWANDKFLVRSPKTERHEGGDSRWVPIFPELRRLLLDAQEQAPDDCEFVIHRYRNQPNLRTQFARIIKRAGLTPWPKLFQNLRSTRQTELAATYPLHLVCAWLGNKAAIAQEHYLQVTDADFKAASTGALLGQTRAELGRSGASTNAQERSRGEENPGKEQVCELVSAADHSGKSIEWAIQDSNL